MLDQPAKPKCKVAAQTKKNGCQSKSSAGHPGSILPSSRTGACLKRVKTDVELDFYRYAERHRLPILKFMPKVRTDSECVYKQNKYIEIENIKSAMEDPVELDIKLGKFASDFRDLRDQGKSILSALAKTSYLRITNVASGRTFRRFAPARPGLMYLPPETVFEDYFRQGGATRQTRKGFRTKLLALRSALKETDEKCKIRMIGASVLLVYDRANPNKTDVKLIDFAHSVMVATKHKSLEYMIQGLDNMIPYLS